MRLCSLSCSVIYEQIRVGRLTSLTQGMTVTTVRDGSNPAQQVIAQGSGVKR